jgi:hypothetical protein
MTDVLVGRGFNSVRRPHKQINPRIREKFAKVPIPRFSIGDYKRSSSNRKQSSSGFDVQVRKKGKFQALGVSLSEEEAKALGQQRVLGGAAATFQIRESGRQAESLGIKVNPRLEALFRPGKVKGQYIQKEKLRIISSGEKRDISSVGAATRRGQNIFGSASVGRGKKIKFM